MRGYSFGLTTMIFKSENRRLTQYQSFRFGTFPSFAVVIPRPMITAMYVSATAVTTSRYIFII